VTKLNPSGTALVYSTYLGGRGRDMGYGIAVDASGAAYLTGRTTSTNYITTTGTLQGGLKGAEDAFVTKLTPAGAVAYSTYLGGSGQEYAANVAVDASGAAYVAGDTVSADFPTPNGAQPVAPGGYGDDGFVAELNPGGTALVYGTYLGGTNIDQALGIALDPAGNVYASGSTRVALSPPTFPTTAGAYQTTNYGGFEAFVVKLNTARSGAASLVYGTLVGGFVDSPNAALAVDAAGDAYIAGQAQQTLDPSTPTNGYPYLDPLQGVVGGGNSDAYVTELNPAGSALVWSVFLGGNGDDGAIGVAVDGQGGVYVTGGTTSTDFTVSGAPQPYLFNNCTDAFVVKLAPLGGGGAIPWHPHHGVSLAGTGVAVSVDLADGHADVTTSDLHIPGRGPDLALGRSWDSTVAQGSLTAGTGGWTSSLTPRVSGSVTGTVLFTDTTNAVWPFRYASYLSALPAYRHYVTPPGLPWTLTTSTAGYTLTNFLTGAAMIFDASGRLVSSQDAYSNTNSMSYGAGSATSPSGEANSGGRALAFGYSNGQLTDAQSPLWQQGGAGAAGSQHVTYGYNGSGQIATRTLGAGTPDAVTTTFGYSGTQLTSITTPANRVWALGYDGQGRVSTLTSPVSGTAGQAGYTPAYTTAISYTRGRTQVVVGLGASGALTTTYTLDAQGEAVATADGRGDTSQASYDSDHDLLTRQDPNGNGTTNAYQYVGQDSSVGLITRTVQPAIQPYSPLTGALITPTTTYRYDLTTYDLLEVDKPAGGVTTYTYDGHHAISATADLTATAPISSWRGAIDRYDQYGELIATTDGRGVSVTASGVASVNGQASVYTSHKGYDAQGDLTSANTPPITTTLNGTTTTAPVTTSESYDGDGNRVSGVSANDATTSDGYDHLGRQVTTTGPSVKLYNGTTTTPVETTGYDQDGNAVRTTDALGAVTTSSYDPLGRQVSTTNPVSGTTITTYNAAEQIATQDPQGNTTTDQYDAAGRLIQATDALTGTVQYGYDAAGNTTAITTGDTSGSVIQVETQQYDALNRAITDTVAGPNGASPQTTTTRYDPDGNVYQINQPNGTTTVDTYDLADDLVTSETDGAPVLTPTHQDQSVYRYDAAGNQVETVDPNGRDTVTTVDGDSRAVGEVSTAPGVTGTTTMTTTTGYDPDGNTLAQTVQTRDPSGNVQTFTNSATYNAADWQTSTTDNGVTTQYGYDAAGQQRTQTYQNGAATATMALDAEGRLTALGDRAGHTSAFGYNANDQTTAITLPNGVSEQASYDANGRLTAWHDPGPGQNVTYGYGHDAASRVTSFTAVSGTDTLTYNPQNRLISDNELTLATRPGCKRRSEAQHSSTSCSWRPLCRADERCNQHRGMR
jgi:YD repeat-containing protein